MTHRRWTKEYRYQLRLRAQGKCPGCQDPVQRFIYCLACRAERRARVNKWNAQQRRAKKAAMAQLRKRPAMTEYAA